MKTINQPVVKNIDGREASILARMPLLDNGDVEEKRQEILEYFHNTFSLYESLFECLACDEAFLHRANRLRQPLIFYYGHTAVFFINKLNVANLIDERIDPKIESLLAIGVDEMSWDDLNDDNYDWPTPVEVKAYRNQTREIVDRFIQECDFSLPIDWNSPFWIVMMGIEHERIHLETSAILIRELPITMVNQHPVWGDICRDHGVAPENELVSVTGGKVELGKSRTNSIYGWDNEYGYAVEEVKEFRTSKYLVSNAEMLDFVNAGGYHDKSFWTEEGRNWLEFSKAEHPVYWLRQDNTFQLRTMLKVIDLPWNWPAEINYLEAKAFCNWKSKATGTHVRMPTEAEWQIMRNELETDQPYWESAPGNINLEHGFSTCPVDRHEFHDGIFDLIGNVWQWTETPIDGYNGFEVHPIYDDFSRPTFDGKHNLFKGGCWISTGNYAIKDARYAFRRHFFQFAGLRYVEAEPLPEPEVNVYESDNMVAKYIEFHYGSSPIESPNVSNLNVRNPNVPNLNVPNLNVPNFNVPNFQVACIEEVSKHLGDQRLERALDIGCAAGRSSFELAKIFEHVDAVDFSVRLIEAPTNLQKSGIQRYICSDEGELNLYREIELCGFERYEAVKDRILFRQGDACNRPKKFNDYDLVFAGNLIDRLYDPEMFLSLIKGRIRKGGFLFLASPYTWSEEYTPREKWLGGFKANTGESFTTLDGIRRILGAEFRMVAEPVDIPFVFRETSRKFQYDISQLSGWEKL